MSKWEYVAEPIYMHGLSSENEHWYRRPVWDDVACGTCGAVNPSKAMYEYGVAAIQGEEITWDEQVYCNLKCLPDDTGSIRRERWKTVRGRDPKRSRKAELNRAASEKYRSHLAKLYEKHGSINKVAEIEGVTKQAVHAQLKKAGVEMGAG